MTDNGAHQSRRQTVAMETLTYKRYPFSYFPTGWYYVARSKELRPGKLVGQQWCGVHIVAWRNEEGKVCVADAYCPHLGARMTPEAGGRVVDGRLKCPFHGFEYDVSGACMHTPNAPPPRTCELVTYPTCERNDVVFAYHGGEPKFELPFIDDEGWTLRIWGKKTFNTHIQEIPENALDLNHFQFVHGVNEVEETGTPEVNGQHFYTAIDTRGRLNLPFARHLQFDSHVDFHMWGLGYFFFETTSPDTGVETRSWLFGVPQRDALLTLNYAVAVRENPSQRLQVLKWLPTQWRTLLVCKLVHMETSLTLEQDREIWNSKRFRASPRLANTDGSILAYRRYCQQFNAPI